MGLHLVRILSLYDCDFHISVKSINCTNNTIKKQIEVFRNLGLSNFIEMDLADANSITYQKLDGIEKIFLLTPITYSLESIRKIITEAKRANSVKHIIKLSSMAAPLHPPTPIDALHRRAEKIIEESGIKFTFLRPNYYMQNFIHLNGLTIKKDKRFFLPFSNSKASFVDVRDVSEIAARILRDTSNKHYNTSYTITGGQSLSCNTIAKIFTILLDEPIKYINITKEQARIRMKKLGIQKNIADSLFDLYELIEDGRLRRISHTVEMILGRKPITFETFVRDNLDAFK